MENKNDITFFIPNIGGGGAERVIVNLANYFAEAGFYVTILLINSSVPQKYEISTKVNLKFLGASRISYAALPLYKYFKKNKPSIFLSALSHANILSILIGILTRQVNNVYISEHGVPKKYKNLDFKQIIINYLMKLLYPKAAKIIAVSNCVEDALVNIVNISRDKVIRIYNPIFRKSVLDKGSLEKVVSQKSSEKIIISAGRLCKEKDFFTIIKALKIVREEVNAKLIILGEGEDYEKIFHYVNKSKLNSHVLMPGFVGNLQDWMSKASIFVLSSPSESFGNVIVEAMLSNIPIVSTDCGGPREILEDGKWGSLVPVGDPDAMANAILTILASPIRHNLRSRAEYFSVENQAINYLRLFRCVKV